MDSPSLKIFPAILFILTLECPAQLSQPLETGRYAVGFRVIKITALNSNEISDPVQLVLNLWYPTERKTPAEIRLLDYAHLHLSTLPDTEYGSVIEREKLNVRSFISKNFGTVNETDWKRVEQQRAYATLEAPYFPSKFPLILGRLRPFSTTYTNEYLASHGYVVCMLNGVEDFPPDNRPAYHGQVTREIGFYHHIDKFLTDSLKITNGVSGSMGFSGGGFSQFIAPMHSNAFQAVALLESGIFLDGDLFEIVSSHPYYHPKEFNTPLLFLYNKGRFEKNVASQRFFDLNTPDKYLILFNDSTQHHWDFATEGTIASLFLNIRGEKVSTSQIDTFKELNGIILKFFNQYLKAESDLGLMKNKATIIEPRNNP
jgi:hypothetical protein